MAFQELFDEAEVLDSLAWLGMPERARIAKLASLYIKKWEKKIDNECRRYYGPEARHLRPFIKHYLIPARGTMKPLIEALLEEIPRQKARIKKRSRFRHATENELLVKPKRINDRRNRVAPNIYSVKGVSPNCVAITRFEGHRMVVDGGCYSALPRVHTTNLETGEVKVFVLRKGSEVKSALGALMRMVPAGTTRKALSGSVVRFSFDEERVYVDGEPRKLITQWVYRGKDEAFDMDRKPGEDK